MKQPIFSIIGFSFFLTLAFPSSEAVASVKAEDVANIAPPTLVECRDELTCDRDSKHLEAFVAGFYRWNEARNIRFFTFAREHLSPEESKKHIADTAKIETHALHKLLTPEFYHWTTIYTGDPPPNPDPHYCPIGTNAITCAQDEFDEWLKATAHAVDVRGNQAHFLVNLPLPSSNERAPLALQISVHLRVVQGVWRIDGVCCPKTIPILYE